MADAPLALCEHAAQLARRDGDRVRLAGTYLPVPTLKKMPRPGRPPETVELGEVVIELDGEAVEYDPAAPAGAPARVALGVTVRPPDEIARLRGRRVTVEGRLRLVGPAARGVATVRPGPVLTEFDEPRPAV